MHSHALKIDTDEPLHYDNPHSRAVIMPGNRMVLQVQFTEQYIYHPRTGFQSVFGVRMGKAADLSKFDKGQIVMSWCLGTSILATGCLLVCLRAAVVSRYQKWWTDGQTTNHHPSMCHLQLTDARGEQRLLHVFHSDRRVTVRQIASNYNSGDQDNVLQQTVHCSLLCMSLCSQPPSRFPC